MKTIYRQLLREAMQERAIKKKQLDFADKDFVESIIYEIKALDSKIEVLKKRTEVEENEEQKEMERWRNLILDYLRSLN